MLLKGDGQETQDGTERFPWKESRARSFLEIVGDSTSERSMESGLPAPGNIIGNFLEREIGRRATGPHKNLWAWKIERTSAFS